MGKRVSLEKKPIDQKPLPHASLDTPPVGEGDSRPPAPETAPNVQDRQTPPPRRPTVVQDRPGATPVQVRVGKMWKRKPIDTEEVNVTVSPLRWRTTFVLALFGGWLGLHRFYLKRYFSAMLFPFLAFGIFMCGYATPYFQKPGSMAIFHAVLILAGLSATFEFFATINNGFVAARGKEPRSSTWTGLLFGGKEYRLLDKTSGKAFTWLNNCISFLFLFGYLCFFLFFLHHREIDRYLANTGFIACSALVGILWCKDCKTIYNGGLTDAKGRPLMDD